MNSSEIRQAFFDFFEKHGHQIVPSSSLIPAHDPTLLFTNAGMVQFKETFLGQETRPYTRAVSSQRCVRAGGKHNDLDNVGYTARHHTFFEMLGNFSFGDYFKQDAIRYAWVFLTQVLHLPAEKLWVTVYQDDDEAADIWLKDIGVSASRLSRCGEKDNFWSMGDTGPCGPCTEIFYDHGPQIPGGPPGTPEADGDRYIEIWNLVFMQFNRDKSGQLHPLPKPAVDTGMGLERIAAVVQGVHNNYEIDTFSYLIDRIAELGKQTDSFHPSLRVIADHIRACSFLIMDGITPGNEGRAYVLRRIIRRAIRHGHSLQLPMPFFSTLVKHVVTVMGDAYPQLIQQQGHIEQVILQEEQQFARTLDQGMRLLEEQVRDLKPQDGICQISGEVAFKLYDTYGFPLDLTIDIARERDIEVDSAGFHEHMQLQREQSLSANAFQVDYSTAIQQLNVKTTFQGYDHESVHSHVLALFPRSHLDVSVATLQMGEKGTVVLKDTPFYAESGGQVGDCGQLQGDDWIFRVDDTQRQGDAILHHGELISGQIAVGQAVLAQVNVARREAIRLNHTATHLVHAALQRVIGAQVEQKGSLVDAERTRFDFSHGQGLTSAEIQQIESLVNEQIRANKPVLTTLMSLDEAKKSGAMALFGEKYTEMVRVLTVDDFSKELCGGTHARHTGDIGFFKITNEYGVASGVRRIEFVTGLYALAWVNQQLAQLSEIAAQLKTKPGFVVDKLSQHLQTMRQQEKEIARLQQKLMVQSGSDLVHESRMHGDIQFLIKRLDHLDGPGLRMMSDQLKSTMTRAVIVLYAIQAEKISVIAAVSQDITKRMAAGTLVKALCGKGGGRDDLAQGGGPVPQDLEARIMQVEELVRGC